MVSQRVWKRLFRRHGAQVILQDRDGSEILTAYTKGEVRA